MKNIFTFTMGVLVGILFMIFTARYAHADDLTGKNDNPWTVTQIVQESVTISTLLIDWHQTRQIADHPGYSERNELLGKHPEQPKINRYFGAVMIGQYLIADALPGYWRNSFLGAVTLTEIHVIGKNKQIGLSWSFK